MLTEDRAQKTVMPLLADADLAFEDGRFREGAGMMWEAARLSIVAVADAKGWPCDTLDGSQEGHLPELDGIDSRMAASRVPWCTGVNFGAADDYREQAETDDEDWPTLEFKWIDVEFRMYQKSVEKSIERMESLLKSEREAV